ncbi:MAG: hypothetical protein JWR80_5783 [Bradyrhizobium sp.]|nr:hypothetical protein [Bradyrhizobium sp.]
MAQTETSLPPFCRFRYFDVAAAEAFELAVLSPIAIIDGFKSDHVHIADRARRPNRTIHDSAVGVFHSAPAASDRCNYEAANVKVSTRDKICTVMSTDSRLALTPGCRMLGDPRVLHRTRGAANGRASAQQRRADDGELAQAPLFLRLPATFCNARHVLAVVRRRTGALNASRDGGNLRGCACRALKGSQFVSRAAGRYSREHHIGVTFRAKRVIDQYARSRRHRPVRHNHYLCAGGSITGSQSPIKTTNGAVMPEPRRVVCASRPDSTTATAISIENTMPGNRPAPN